MQSERRYIASQPIGTIWSAVCELAKGGMFKVEYIGTNVDLKLVLIWFLFSHVGFRAGYQLFVLKVMPICTYTF